MASLQDVYDSRHIHQFPHCDSRILHKPGACKYCDEHPEWQELREAWGINYTGEYDPTKLPCPAETKRPLDRINRWGGNTPRPANSEEE